MSAISVRLPDSIHKMAREVASEDHFSLNQFIASAVAEKVGTLKTADIFLAERAGRAKRADLLRYLRKAPKTAPVRGDERPK